MLKLCISHVYGNTSIKSLLCPRCGYSAFVIDGRMSCCGKKPTEDAEPEDYKVHVDRVGARRRTPGKWERERCLEEQSNCCFYCGDEFGSYRNIDGDAKQVRLTWDHVVPFSYDGNNHKFVAACSVCNAIKYNRHFPDLEAAKVYLKQRIHEKKTVPPRKNLLQLS